MQKADYWEEVDEAVKILTQPPDPPDSESKTACIQVATKLLQKIKDLHNDTVLDDVRNQLGNVLKSVEEHTETGKRKRSAQKPTRLPSRTKRRRCAPSTPTISLNA